MLNKNILIIALVTAGLLMIPLIGMQVSSGWNWTAFDFIFAGTLIFGTGLAYELIARKAGALAYRAATGVALGAGFLLVWINGAVGIIGEDNIFNLLYLGVIVIGIIGAILTHLRPQGMTRTLLVMAIIQIIIPVGALFFAPQLISQPPGVIGVFALNTFFALLFIGSALLFRRASNATLR